MAEIREREREDARPFCADVSRELSESLAATASRIDNWLLVEYRSVWSRDVLGRSSLSDEVKRHLGTELAALPNSRLLFIRRPERRARDGLAVYFATSSEHDATLHALEIEDHEELRRLSLRSFANGSADGARPVEHPLFVVCTHGKRDRCCAKYGRPLFDEVREQVEADWVWQSTHVGGDRFAGNVVCLPEGLYFGRVERPDVWPLLDEYLSGRIQLEHYRGRSCYPFHVQAAERAVRIESGLTGIEDLTLSGCRRSREGAWDVAFDARGELYEVEVEERLADEPTHLTCGALSPARPRRHEATVRRVRTRT